MKKSKKSQSGFGLIEFVLLSLLAIVMMVVTAKVVGCSLKPLPFAGRAKETAICRSTEAVNYTRIVFMIVGIGLPAFLYARNRADRRRG